MTEREYIDATDLGKINSLISSARCFCYQNMSKTNAKKFREAYGLLYDIQENLFKKVKVK